MTSPRTVTGSFALVVVALLGCGRSASPPIPPSRPHEPSTPGTDTEPGVCTEDADCVFASACCPGCGDLTAPFAVITREEARAARERCDPDERCPYLDCAAPPPCLTAVRAWCRDGRCAAKGESVEIHGAAIGPCNCDGCGPPPDLSGLTGADGDRECVAYHQLMYERCCCLHSGLPHCDGHDWIGWDEACRLRDRCAPDAATRAAIPDLDGCRLTVTRGPQTPPAGDFAARWVASTRSAPLGDRMIIWEREHGLGFIDPATGQRWSFGISGRGAPSSPHPFATADGLTLVLSGWGLVSFTLPTAPGSVDVIRALAVEGAPEVRGVTPDLTTLLLYESGRQPATWSLVRFDAARAVFAGWTTRTSATPAFIDGTLAPDGSLALVELACQPIPCTTTWARLERDTGKVTPIALGDLRAPRWLPDGRVLYELAAPGTRRLVTAPRADLAASTVWRDGAWSPAVTANAPTRVAYLVADESCRDVAEPTRCLGATLETADLDGGDRRTVTTNAAGLPAQAWSVDGRWIAFQVNADGRRFDLRVCRADGSACRDLGDLWLRGWLR